MPNTQPNLNLRNKAIHETFRVSDLSAGLTLALSSEKDTLAQIELTNLSVHRRLGRRVLMMNVVDKTEFAELQGKPQAFEQLAIPLGHTALIGRDRLSLPLFQSQLTISENHLELGYLRTAAGDTLSIHDYESVNGSHVVSPHDTRPSWRDKINELSRETIYHQHNDTSIPDDAYEWVYDPDQTRSPRTP